MSGQSRLGGGNGDKYVVIDFQTQILKVLVCIEISQGAEEYPS
jgi:hypothetical protein